MISVVHNFRVRCSNVNSSANASASSQDSSTLPSKSGLQVGVVGVSWVGGGGWTFVLTAGRKVVVDLCGRGKLGLLHRAMPAELPQGGLVGQFDVVEAKVLA